MDSDNINSWKKGVVRALKKYIANGTEVPGVVCPSCNQEGTLFYEENCYTCKSCGFSGCD